MSTSNDTLPADAATELLCAKLGLTSGALTDVFWAWVEHSHALVAVKEISTGRYVYANAPMAALFDRTDNELTGLVDSDLMDSSHWSALRTADQAAANGSTAQVSEHRIERSGQRREFSVLRRVLPNADGSAPRYLCTVWTEITATRQKDIQLQRAFRQIEEEQHANTVLRRDAHHQGPHDSVTGLYHRQHFDDQLRREVDLSSREHREFALVSVVLDPLSATALSLGSAAHTRVLETLGRLLRSNTRAMDAACCIDDDHFAVLLSGVGLATAHSRMEGLRRQCATQIVILDGQELGFSISMGVSSFPHTALTQEELFQASEGAMREAQRRGGNRVTLASISFESV